MSRNRHKIQVMGKGYKTLSFLSLFFILFFGTHDTIAEKKIAVLEIDGARKSKLRNTVVRLLEPNTTISSQAYNRKAKKLRAKKVTPRNVKRVAKAIGADGVLFGSVASRAGKYNVVFRLRSGKTGQLVKKITLRVSSLNLSKSIQSQLKAKLDQGVAVLSDGGAGKGSVKSSGGISVGRASLDGNGKPTGKSAGGVKTNEDLSDGREFIDLEEERLAQKEAEKKKIIKPKGIFLRAGVGALRRNLSFNSVRLVQDPPVRFRSSFVPTLNVSGELYPLVLAGNTGILSGLGLVGSYQKALTVNTTLNGEELESSFDHLRVGGTYRVAFGRKKRDSSVGFSIAYNLRNFNIATGASGVVEIPSVNYAYLDPGIDVRSPFGVFTFYFSARLLWILDEGDIGQPNLYGPSKVTGVNGDVGFEFGLVSKVVLRLGARYSRFGYEFDDTGTPGELADRNGDGVLDVPGALDTYLGGYGELGIQF